MNQPTHFIEVWTGSTGIQTIEPVKPILWMDISINATSNLNFKTVFVWKITPHN